MEVLLKNYTPPLEHLQESLHCNELPDYCLEFSNRHCLHSNETVSTGQKHAHDGYNLNICFFVKVFVNKFTKTLQ